MPINRREAVKRHNPVLKKIGTPLSVGNGNFVFTADVTGLQSLDYDEITPLCTMSQWGEHTLQPGKFYHEDFKMSRYSSNQRVIPMMTSRKDQEECYNWLRENPHKINLARIGFLLNGKRVKPEMITGIEQELALWQGILRSKFLLNNIDVEVKTAVHGEADFIGFEISSLLWDSGELSVEITFPYGSPQKNASDWGKEESHKTTICGSEGGDVQLLRTLDSDMYFCMISSCGQKPERTGAHSFVLKGGDAAKFTVGFAKQRIIHAYNYRDVFDSAKKTFENYWSNGGFIDFTECTDERAFELSRRVVLSQYLTFIQCSGDYPPQETGLTTNSWYGKAHLEMHYWHSFHFLLFGKQKFFENSLWWYENVLGEAKKLANSQGFKGARWPKMPWKNGKDSPSPIAPLLIWQQPHPINYCAALYKAYIEQGKSEVAREILGRYRDIVFETADFMASFAYYDKTKQRFVLGPAIIPAQENHAPEITLNPVFELEYWRFGLEKAIEWAELLDEPPHEEWLEVMQGIAKPSVYEKLYPAHENCTETYTKFNYDHPSFLCALGVLPGKLIDAETMKNSLMKVLDCWDYEQLWGWDFPVLAMTAARLGMVETAVDCLLLDSPKNTYSENGHNNQIPRSDLQQYLPGNGGLLIAAALMCAGYEGCAADFSGFPKNGKWNVKFEELHKML